MEGLGISVSEELKNGIEEDCVDSYNDEVQDEDLSSVKLLTDSVAVFDSRFIFTIAHDDSWQNSLT